MKKRTNKDYQQVQVYRPGDVSKVNELERRIEALEATYASQIERLSQQVNILSQALRLSHDRSSYIINENGLDVVERLRPRR